MDRFCILLAVQQSRFGHTEHVGWRHGSGPAACPVCGPPPAWEPAWGSRCMSSAGFAVPQVHNHVPAPPTHSLGAARLRLGRVVVGLALLTMFAADGSCVLLLQASAPLQGTGQVLGHHPGARLTACHHRLGLAHRLRPALRQGVLRRGVRQAGASQVSASQRPGPASCT